MVSARQEKVSNKIWHHTNKKGNNCNYMHTLFSFLKWFSKNYFKYKKQTTGEIDLLDRSNNILDNTWHKNIDFIRTYHKNKTFFSKILPAVKTLYMSTDARLLNYRKCPQLVTRRCRQIKSSRLNAFLGMTASKRVESAECYLHFAIFSSYFS